MTWLLGAGCDRDARLADYAERARQDQNRLNERMAEQSASVLRQNEQLAQAAQKLVEHDAAARRELAKSQAALQAEFQASASALDRQRERLALDRRQAEQAAQREPLVAMAIWGAALLLGSLLPLLIAAYAIARLPPHTPGESWLLDEFTEQELLPQVSTVALPANTVPAKDERDQPKLPAPPEAVDGGDFSEQGA